MRATDTRPAVLVTGASGLIGSRVVERLSPHYRVVGFDVVAPPRSYPDDADFIPCNLTSEEATRRAIGHTRELVGPELASVVHLADHYDFSGEPSRLYEELTVEGTRCLLRALRKSASVGQFVFGSSLLVMEPAHDDAVLAETSPVEAEWEYPQSKLAAEAVIRRERGDIHAVVLRIGSVYDEDGHSPALAQQIWRIRESKLGSFLFPGNRSHGQSFVHVEDVSAFVRAVVDRRHELDPYEIFLVGEPEVLTYGELQNRIGELVHGHAWPTLRIPAPIAKIGAWIKEKNPLMRTGFCKPWMVDLADAHYPITIERARRRLGWEPRHRLADTLPHMIDRLSRDPRAWYEENRLPLEGEEDPVGADPRAEGS